MHVSNWIQWFFLWIAIMRYKNHKLWNTAGKRIRNGIYYSMEKLVENIKLDELITSSIVQVSCHRTLRVNTTIKCVSVWAIFHLITPKNINNSTPINSLILYAIPGHWAGDIIQFNTQVTRIKQSDKNNYQLTERTTTSRKINPLL